mgnify:CR=1 FL=1
MERDDDATQLIQFFDANDKRGFDVALRGYDRAQVDEFLARVEGDLEAGRSKVLTLEAEVTRLRGELEETQRALDEAEHPTYAWLGAGAVQLLRLA